MVKYIERCQFQCKLHNMISFPKLQGTLAKLTKHALQTNYSEEALNASSSNESLKKSANFIVKLVVNKNPPLPQV